MNFNCLTKIHDRVLYLLFFSALTAVFELTLQRFFIKNSFRLEYIWLAGSPPVTKKRKKRKMLLVSA